MSFFPRTVRLTQLMLLSGAMSASFAATSPSASRSYIVLLKEAPAASYRGGVAGFAATQVPEGQKLNARAAAVQAYRAHLAGEQQKLISSLGPVKLLHRYNVAFNGFSAVLTEAQAKKLRANSAVSSVLADERREATTITTPLFLGLDGPGGVWTKKVQGVLEKGENVIVAVVDSGIQPENPAFYDHVDANGTPVKTGGTLAYQPLPAGQYSGTCTTGAGFTADSCNNKLIGAQVFSAGYQQAVAQGAVTPFLNFYDVPRDEVGHGSHTLSTAGGNANAPAYTSAGIYVGTTSGMAPRARVATYKALFGTIAADGSLGGNGFNSDLVAAIDQAVADGVDVINYSISGSQTNLLDPVEVAFLNATAAGVFVAASAGNSGPGNQVAHNSPWLTTVAASTHDRQFIADLSLGNGTGPYTGASFDPAALPSASMVLSSDIPAAGVPVANANLCFLNSLDSTKAVGKIVVCDRGTNARVEKSQEVARVGGVGMVLINPSANTVVADFHSVPTVHLDAPSRTAVRNYVTSSGASATGAISARYQAPNVVAPIMASFSSRGPNLAELSVMKPEITAPGVDVIASVTYAQQSQADHDAILAGTLVPSPVVESYQGTSMSTPHIAGIAALIKQAHPNWPPAQIKSAMVTSTTGVKLASGAPDTNPNGYGAGHVNPRGAADPGLVYPINPADYLSFLCGANWLAADDANCLAFGSAAPSNLNLPTVAADVPGTLTIKRHVRNVGTGPAIYSASATVPGFVATVTPPTLSLAKNEVAAFTLTLKTNGAALNTGVFGNLSWTDGAHVVTSPVLARARALSAPAVLSSTAATGSAKFKVAYGFDGATSALVTGLKPATRTAGTVALNAQVCFNISVPADALVVRAALYNADTSGNGGDDLDMTLLNPSGTTVASSGGATADELVSVTAPVAGTYKACVQGYNPVGGSSNFTLSSWVLSAADAGGSLAVTGLPTTVAVADQASVKASWSGLANLRYLGGIRYAKGDGSTVGTTLLTVEPNAPSLTLGASDMSARKARIAASR